MLHTEVKSQPEYVDRAFISAVVLPVPLTPKKTIYNSENQKQSSSTRNSKE